MAIPFRVTRTRQLTHAGLVLSRRKRHSPFLWALAGGLAAAALATTGFMAFAREGESVRELAHARSELHTLNKALNESQLQARMTEARAKELERQVDGLNQRLREMEDELAFFRKAQDSKR
ncbi:hypothetical protein OPU71_08775 [Niveibacterium sp. 24ML]|uniref:hypothetical protein n=1 Tax=Niveibacterium sp. 24ML TaxID=2985512 RepID=UPI002270C8DB|nr:hypothetical protein [Niveibacterium sp. 24ML]MCX9156213.1 hypothetical protein [Niveibacterium sp. 24ML]